MAYKAGSLPAPGGGPPDGVGGTPGMAAPVTRSQRWLARSRADRLERGSLRDISAAGNSS